MSAISASVPFARISHINVYATGLTTVVYGAVVGRWKASLIATTVVLVVVIRFRKMPKALLIRNGKSRNFAYTFMTSFPTDLPS